MPFIGLFPFPSLQFSASNLNTSPGDPSTLSWSSTLGTILLGGQPVPRSGTQIVNPFVTTTYTMSLTDPNGLTLTETVTITVAGPVLVMGKGGGVAGSIALDVVQVSARGGAVAGSQADVVFFSSAAFIYPYDGRGGMAAGSAAAKRLARTAIGGAVVGSVATVTTSQGSLATNVILLPRATMYPSPAILPVQVLTQVGANGATGQVGVSIDGSTPVVGNLQGGTAVFSVAGLGIGAHQLSAVYPGSTPYAPSQALGSLTIVGVPTSTVLIAPNQSQTASPQVTVVVTGSLFGDGALAGGGPYTFVGQAPPSGSFPGVVLLSETSLGQPGIDAAAGCFTVVQSDHQKMQSFFSPTASPWQISTLVVQQRSVTSTGIGGAIHLTSDDPICYCDLALWDWRFVETLFLSELAEVGEALVGNGGSSSFSNGEALSRVLSEQIQVGMLEQQIFVDAGSTSFRTSLAWLNSTSPARPNFVSIPGDQIDPIAVGCGVLFLYWLRQSPNNFSFSQIAQAGFDIPGNIGTAGSLAILYDKLKGLALSDTQTGWMAFITAVNARWPAGVNVNSGANADNLWTGLTVPPIGPVPAIGSPSTAPQGTAYLRVNGVTFANMPLDSTGRAIFTLSPLSPGSYALAVDFVGAGCFGNSSQTGNLVIVGSGPVITLNPATTFQTMRGWEALAYAGEFDDSSSTPTGHSNITAGYSNYQDTLLRLDAVNDLGINRLRLEIKGCLENTVDNWNRFITGVIALSGPVVEASVNDDANPNSVSSAITANPNASTFPGFIFSALDFKIDQIVTAWRAAVLARGETPWVNLCYVDFSTQSFMQWQNANEYAEFVLAVYQHIKVKYGWVPDSLELKLEPDAGATGGGFNGTLMGQAMLAIAGQLTVHGFTPRFVLPSTSNPNNFTNWWNQVKAVPGITSAFISQNILELSYHRYSTPTPGLLASIAAEANTYGISTAMLEFDTGTYINLHEDLKVANVSSWQRFALGDWYPNALKYYQIDKANPNAPTVTMLPDTKFLRQYFKFIRKGAVRIDAQSSSGNFDAVAFINSDTNAVMPGKWVVVVKALASGTFSIAGLPAGTYGIKYTTAAAFDVDLSDQTIPTSGSLSTTIPAVGVITIYGK